MIELRDSTAEPQNDVQYACGKPIIAPGAARMPVTHEEWVEFLRITRRILVELTRWIERRYPETVS